MSATRPDLLEFLGYAYGIRRLPDSMRDWVANDLAGPGSVRRFMIRMAIPPIFVLVPFWFFPVEQDALYVHSTMTVPIYLWALAISLALNKVWRRHRLAAHGLDANLVDVLKREKNARVDEDYVARFGPRPQEADHQKNSNPFF